MTYVIVEAYKMALVRLLVDLVDRLERRYLNGQGHASPVRTAVADLSKAARRW